MCDLGSDAKFELEFTSSTLTTAFVWGSVIPARVGYMMAAPFGVSGCVGVQGLP